MLNHQNQTCKWAIQEMKNGQTGISRERNYSSSIQLLEIRLSQTTTLQTLIIIIFVFFSLWLLLVVNLSSKENFLKLFYKKSFHTTFSIYLLSLFLNFPFRICFCSCFFNTEHDTCKWRMEYTILYCRIFKR